MSTQVKQADTNNQTLSEKALRLLAAHDREAKGFDGFMTPSKAVNRWA